MDTSIKLQIPPGTSIERAARAAKDISVKLGFPTCFRFNGIDLEISTNKSINQVIKEYNQGQI